MIIVRAMNHKTIKQIPFKVNSAFDLDARVTSPL